MEINSSFVTMKIGKNYWGTIFYNQPLNKSHCWAQGSHTYWGRAIISTLGAQVGHHNMMEVVLI